MPFAEAASSSSSSFNDLKKNDVFISFRGEDTRDNFTSHLQAALRRNQIEAYTDNNLNKGDEVWPALVAAIRGSSVSLVIFSENYASSSWCLNEVVEIMECKKIGSQHVIPVFYRVDPSDVRKQTGSYRTAFEEHTRHSKRRRDTVHKWKDALFEAANLGGFDSRAYRTESDLIESIIQMVLRKLNHKYTNELRGPFIRDQNYASIESSLRTDPREIRIIGIWGMGGIGKTTIAAAIFQEFSSKYDGSCFLANVREESERLGLNHIFRKLVSELLQEDVHIGTSKLIPSAVMSRLRRKKVLVVLDDANTSELVENLLGVGHDYLGAGSRVIVTTRDKHVLTSRAVDEIHEIKQMSFQDSLQLFSLFAFNRTDPEKGYEDLSKRAVVNYAKGIPLALKVLGSFLRSSSENEWESALTKLKKIPNPEIQKVLRLSYDELEDTEKNIFLDIACFFKGHTRQRITRILNACGFFADIGIRNLLDKALITTSRNCIEMHDLIQEMGREVVRQESIKNPGGRSRLWDPVEVCDVLKRNKETDAVESIYLDMTKITDLHLSSHGFRKMPNLRLLAFDNGISFGWKQVDTPVCLPMDLELSNNLRYIQWDGCPLKSLSTTCWPEKLVELIMPDSKVDKLWNGVQNLPNLEIIEIGGSKHLTECPDLSCAPNLKYVSFFHCKSLPHVHPSIFSLEKLEHLIVSGCKSLKSLCSNRCLPSLQTMAAEGCSNLQEFAVTMPNDHYKTTLYLGSTALNQVPSSILHLRYLGEFSFSISESLMLLPENFAERIILSDPKKNEECDAFITLRKVFSSSGFWSVRVLSFYGCHSFSEFPDNISLLSSVESLAVFESDIIRLPESIKYLPRLKHLIISHCKMLQSVPALPQSIQCLDAWDSISLRTVLSSPSEPFRKHKCTFLLHNCIQLDEETYDAILKDAILGIELGAKQVSAVAEDEYSDDGNEPDAPMVRDGMVCYFLPARSSKIRDWFHYCSTRVLINNIELPPNSKFLGLVFYFILSQVQSSQVNPHVEFGCDCSLETCWGERVKITSFFVAQGFFSTIKSSIKMTSDHVFLWYDAQCCKQIMEAIEEGNDNNERSTTYNPKLTFEFFARTKDNEEAVIKECGIRWIYPLDDETMDKGRWCKSKRSRKFHELEAMEFQNGVEGYDEQE